MATVPQRIAASISLVGLLLFTPFAFIAFVFAAVGVIWPILVLLGGLGASWIFGSMAAFVAPAKGRIGLAVTVTFLIVFAALLAAIGVSPGDNFGPWALAPLGAGLAAIGLFWRGLTHHDGRLWMGGAFLFAATLPFVGLVDDSVELIAFPVILAVILAACTHWLRVETIDPLHTT